MDKNYEVRIVEEIYSNRYKWIKKLLDLLIKAMSIIVIVGSFTGEVSFVVNRLCIENNLGMGTIMRFVIVYSSVIYIMYYIFKMFIDNKPIKILIRDICSCYIIMLVGFNYGVYYQETNDINTIFLIGGYSTLYIAKYLINILSEYKIWKSIYEDGIAEYGYKYNEYKKVNLVLNESFRENDKLNICLNKFNNGEDNLMLDIVTLEIRLKKYFIRKSKKDK